MQQKAKGDASDPTTEHVETDPCPGKRDELPNPKRGAFPTPKAIIESAPRYVPDGSEEVASQLQSQFRQQPAKKEGQKKGQ
jgi:hypothetical protein